MEVAKEIGISQAQVSRLEKGSLERIKITFKEFFERFRSGTASPPEKPQHKALKAISQQENAGDVKNVPGVSL